MREAEGAFGDPTVFLEQAVVEPRHIEVQILADGEGNVIHLFERDCSVQRRHQKVVEIAPAPNLDPRAARPDLRRRGRASPREIGYRNAGTVEFLLDPHGQLRLHRDEPAHPGRAHGDRGGHRRRPGAVAAADRGRRDAGRPRALARTPIQLRGAALQCRITTEDPANGFRPDTGRITTYRSPGGAGRPPRRRHDVHRRRGLAPTSTRCWPSSPAAAATSTWPSTGPAARSRSSGSAASPPTSRSCRRCSTTRTSRPAGVTTAFIEDHPQLLTARLQRDRGTKLLTYLADVTVNQPHGAGAGPTRPGRASCPPLDLDGARAATAPASSCCELGPGGVRRARCARRTRVAVTDTTFRDAHQSLLATRVRTRDLLAVAGHVARHDAAAVVAGGVGRRDVRRGAALPRRGPVGAAGRAAAGGAQHLPADAAARAQHGRLHAVPDRGDRRLRRRRRPATGIDVFRIFDALNDVEQMRPAIEAVRATGTRRRRGGALLHRRPVRPGREALHARLLPAAGRADRRRRRARAGDQGHGRAAARARGAHPGDRAARASSTCRCTCTPTTPPAASSPRCSPRSTPGSTRSTRRPRRWPARPRSRRCPRWSPRPTTPTRETGLSLDGGLRPRALLGGDPPGLRAVRVRAARRRPAGSTPTRSPAGSSPTCASRRSRSAWARSSSRSRTCTPPPTTSSATSSR